MAIEMGIDAKPNERISLPFLTLPVRDITDAKFTESDGLSRYQL